LAGDRSVGGKPRDAVKEEKVCNCVTDPFGALPPELQPPPKKKGSLRNVSCPSCGKEYWTNREADLCIECERVSTHEHTSQA
jgi:hypothetical protein